MCQYKFSIEAHYIKTRHHRLEKSLDGAEKHHQHRHMCSYCVFFCRDSKGVYKRAVIQICWMVSLIVESMCFSVEIARVYIKGRNSDLLNGVTDCRINVFFCRDSKGVYKRAVIQICWMVSLIVESKKILAHLIHQVGVVWKTVRHYLLLRLKSWYKVFRFRFIV